MLPGCRGGLAGLEGEEERGEGLRFNMGSLHRKGEMRRTWKSSLGVTVGVALMVVGVAGAGLAQAIDPLESGRTYTSWLYDGAVEPLFAVLSDELRDGLGGEAGLRAFSGQVASQLGEEAEVLFEHAAELGGESYYVRTARFQRFGGEVVVAWFFDDQGEVSSFYVRPRPAEAPTEYERRATVAPLRLPFTGEWIVFWGGRRVELNYHAATPDQRFAYDIVAVENGRRFKGEGQRNEDYYCFGRPILAPADGRVVVAVDGVPDNVPGEMNPNDPPGNHVVLDHGTGEYSFLAHFREGTVRVRPGDTVASGDVLGECGNSGNSSEPHLHYHLQTTPDFAAGLGLPAQFHDYLADGEPVDRGEPIQGQRIMPARDR